VPTVAELVAGGFGLGLTVYVFVWGVTLPIRWFVRLTGL